MGGETRDSCTGIRRASSICSPRESSASICWWSSSSENTMEAGRDYCQSGPGNPVWDQCRLDPAADKGHVVEEFPPHSPASALHALRWASAAVALSSANWQLLHEHPRGCRVDCRGDYSDCALHDKYGATGLTFISGGIVFALPLQRICDGSECP